MFKPPSLGSLGPPLFPLQFVVDIISVTITITITITSVFVIVIVIGATRKVRRGAWTLHRATGDLVFETPPEPRGGDPKTLKP